jgi:hypothetical protein
MNKHKILRLSLTLLISVLLIWIISYWISHNAFQVRPGALGDLATVLFGAASIALFILSMFIALVAVFGWQSLQENIRSSVETETRKAIDRLVKERMEPLENELRTRAERLVGRELGERMQPLENELRGRVYSILGLVMGETNIDPETFAPKDKDLLREAVINSRKGYELLQKTDSPGKYLALNNLVYYSSLVGDRSKGKLMLEYARLLRDAGQEHDARNLLLTYCRAVIEFALDPADTAEAYAIAHSIADDPTRPERERREAKLYLTSLQPSQAKGKSSEPE